MSSAISLPPVVAATFSRRVRRGGLTGAAVIAFLIAAVGVLHTPVGRPLLAKLGVGCPITKATPEQIDHARTIPAAAYLGKARAPARPALGFTFEGTTLADVEGVGRAERRHLREAQRQRDAAVV